MRSVAGPAKECQLQFSASVLVPLHYCPGGLSECYGRERVQETENSVEEVAYTTLHGITRLNSAPQNTSSMQSHETP